MNSKNIIFKWNYKNDNFSLLFTILKKFLKNRKNKIIEKITNCLSSISNKS